MITRAILIAAFAFAPLLPPPTAAAERKVEGNRVTEGVPELPERITERMRQYQNTRSASVRGWTSNGDGLLISGSLALLTGLFCLTLLPHTPPGQTVRQPLAFLNGFRLLSESRPFLVLFVVCLVVAAMRPFFYNLGFLFFSDPHGIGLSSSLSTAAMSIGQVVEIGAMLALAASLRVLGSRWTILLGAAGIVALAALLTVLLPFHSVTDEIASRTRPTTLDLGIAVFSGLAGAVVTASREARLSASIPGVAVAVALVPPLGVAGFGIAIGKVAIAKGALLLFGANLAGIVLSGMLVFLIIGMHRAPVVKAASAWHATEGSTGFAARIHEARWLNRLPGLASPLARVLLVVAFMAAVAVPLTSSLRQVVREGRVSQAIDAVEAQLARAVAEAGVTGRPDELRGESIKGFVTLRMGQEPSEDMVAALKAHVRHELGPIAVPSEIEFTPTLPKTRSGKIMRRLLKAIELGLDPGDITTLEE